MPFIPDPSYFHRTTVDGAKPALVLYTGNPEDVNAAIARLNTKHFEEREKAERALGDNAAAPLYRSNCTTGNCIHCQYTVEHFKKHGECGAARKRFVVACDPAHTKVADDCVECVELKDKSIIVRVHLALPETLECVSRADREARLATLSTYIAKNLRDSTAAHLFDWTHDGAYTGGGFTVGKQRVALTVESVFDHVAGSERYHLNHNQSSMYLSRVTLTHTVTDEELYRHLCSAKKRGVSTEAAARLESGQDSRTKRALRVLARIYDLAQCLGWANARLFNRCSTTPVYGTDTEAAPLLRQRFNPDYHGIITRFCFRHLVSEAILRAADQYTCERKACLPLVCHFPCGARLPKLTARQAAVLQAQHLDASARPGEVSVRRWRRVCARATKRGVKLLAVFADLGLPLRDADGAVINETSARYTAALAHDYDCYVISNKPMRDYTCLVNARCAACLVQQRHAGLHVDADVFDAWVTYWGRVQSAVAWTRREMVSGMLYCHMMRAFGVPSAEVRSCVMEGRVIALVDNDPHRVVVVFPAMNRVRRVLSWRGDALPALGDSVLFSVRAAQVGKPSLWHIPNALSFSAELPNHWVPELAKVTCNSG